MEWYIVVHVCDSPKYESDNKKRIIFIRDCIHYIPHKIFLRIFNPLNAELNPICHLLALLGVHHFLHISRIKVKSLTLRPLTCWDRGFESHRGHGYLSVVSVVCCQVEVSATSWSLVQRSPSDCGASLCVI